MAPPSSKPYKPYLGARARYHPLRVAAVVQLADEEVRAYFEGFGRVRSVRRGRHHVVIEFEAPESVDRVMAVAHALEGCSVRVLREHTVELPSRPFPCMDPVPCVVAAAWR